MKRKLQKAENQAVVEFKYLNNGLCSRYAKQKHPGYKKVRSSPTYVRPKALISAEAKKSPIKDISNYLNEIQ